MDIGVGVLQDSRHEASIEERVASQTRYDLTTMDHYGYANILRLCSTKVDTKEPVSRVDSISGEKLSDGLGEIDLSTKDDRTSWDELSFM